jgi:toluene monooxygenase system protein D
VSTTGGDDRVGPVLTSGSDGLAVVNAIRALNADVTVLDRGAYLRILVPHRCLVTRAAIEQVLGRAFRLPGDLELLMPSFKGFLRIDEDEAVWAFEQP